MYGYDSCATSIRIMIIPPLSAPPSATSFEVRAPGADTNPTLRSRSVIFQLCMLGVVKQLNLTTPISTYQSYGHSGVELGDASCSIITLTICE
ncbi:hypothetical protein CY34DRAFT_802095 [Suillus luteus UH-Slu-Lm8-n1]|uniref:Uncharacterized protein n=1 Tax=Suillus luteus UH-Slu-Lm8-n1 TaxID=930992 RepID=A0A0D0BG09_9AGAM|nr:hypothetical protein CY34DRAFT_802095 [Suillus luteus UH-Slu-Lm8-n1]